MTKHRKSRRTGKTRRTRRSQKGGNWYNPMSWFSSSEPADPYAPGIVEKTKQVAATANDYVGNVAQSGMDAVSSLVPNFSSSEPSLSEPSSSVEVVNQETAVPPSMVDATYGGRRRRRSRSMKGGNDIAANAAPVSGLQVVKPTYWIYSNTNQTIPKGGSRKHKTRKSHRHRK